MTQGISKWGTNPIGEYLERVGELVIDAHDPASSRPVEEALIARGGALETVVWVALDGYADHEVFFQDDQPAADELRKLHSWTPSQEQMPRLTAYFQQHYASCRTVDAAFIEIPDTYTPHIGRRPRVNIAAYYDPANDTITLAAKARPLRHQDRILEDVNKLVPADDLDAFLRQIDRTLTAEITAEYDWRLLTGPVRDSLEADPDFQNETVNPIPEGTHPKYEGQEAELWQKPISTIDDIDSSQGFLQVWLPVDDPDTGVITATRGAYDERTVVEATRDRFDTADVAAQ